MQRLILRRLAAVVLTSGAVSAAALLTAIASARALGPSGRGELAAVVVPFTAVVSIVGGGVPYAVASLGAKHGRRPGRIESTGIVIASVLGLIASMLLVGWAEVFGSGARSLSYVVAALCVPPTILVALFLEYERQRGAGTLFNSVRFTAAVVSAGGTLFLAVMGVTDVGYYVLALAAPNLLILAVVSVWRAGLFGVQALAFDGAAASRIWGSASRAWPSAVTDTILTRAAQLVLVLLAEPDSVGIYAVAVTVAESGGLLRNAIVATYYERLATDSGATLARHWRSMQVLMFSLTIPAYAVIAVACYGGLTGLLGQSFDASKQLIVVLLAAQLALDLHLSAGTVLLARSRPGLFSRTSAVAAGIQLAILVPAVARFGVTGACFATLIGYGFAAVMTRNQASRLIRIESKEAQ